MKQLMNRNLFFAIVDAFECEILKFRDCRRIHIGSALHCPKEERQKHLDEAEQWHTWEEEAMKFKKQFTELFEPDMG